MAAREGFARIGLVLTLLSWLFIMLLMLGSFVLLFTSWWIPAFVGLGIANLLTWILMGFLDKAGDK